MANYEIPIYPIRRLRYFNNQFLKEQDFIDEQAHLLARAQAHLRSLCVAGVCEGLTVRIDAGKLLIAPGVAIDVAGRMIVLDAEQAGPSATTLADGDYLLHVTFHEEEDVLAPPIAGGAQGNTRWTQKPVFGATRTGTTAPSEAIMLGTFSVVQAAVTAISAEGSRYSGIRFPGPSADGAATLANRSDGSADGLLLGGDLTMRRDVAGGTLGPTLTLTNGVAYPGGASSGAAIDFNAYDPGVNAPALRLQAVGDNAGSSHLAISMKQPGAVTNNLVERLRITSLGVLQFSNELKDKVVIYDGGPTDRYGLGLAGSNLALFCPPTSRLSLRQNSSTGAEVFTVSGAGALSASGSVSTPSLNAQTATITGGLTVTGSTNLAGLSASGATLGSLTVTGSTNLAGLNASGTTLGSLSVTGSTNLAALNASGTTLGSLTVSGSTNLAVLSASGTTLGSLTVSGSTNLAGLSASETTLGSLTVAGPTNLAGLSASETTLGSLTVNGPIIPKVGSDQNSGIRFPHDPGGGSGDEAFLTYSVESGETTTLTLGINNDLDDALVLWQGGAPRIKIANNIVRIYGQLELDSSPVILSTSPPPPPPTSPPPTSPPPTSPPPTSPPPTDGGGGGCLLGGQKLVMSDLSLKNIEDVTVGDTVYTIHETTQEPGAHRVTRTMIASSEIWYDIETVSGRIIKCSPTHLFMVNGQAQQARDIRASDSLTTFVNGTPGNDAIRKIALVDLPTKVYNIEVEGAHTYLTDNLILHHNKVAQI